MNIKTKELAPLRCAVLFGKAVTTAEEAGTAAYRDFVLRGISTIDNSNHRFTPEDAVKAPSSMLRPISRSKYSANKYAA